jgi:hypothetical protein
MFAREKVDGRLAIALHQMERLLQRSGCLYLTLIQEEGSVCFRAAMRLGTRTEHVERETLEELLEALSVEFSKKCSHCGTVKPLSHFSKRSDGQGRTGRVSRCKICERIRLRRWYPRANRKASRRRDRA